MELKDFWKKLGEFINHGIRRVYGRKRYRVIIMFQINGEKDSVITISNEHHYDELEAEIEVRKLLNG